MRKQALIIVFLLVSLVTSAQAEEKNGWYLGTKMGWSHFNPLKNYIHSSKSVSAPILGIFLGYEFNPYFGVEIENDTNGFSPHLMFQKSKEKEQLNSVQLSTKLSYPITDEFHLYSRLGGTISWDNLSSKENIQNIFTKKSSLLPSLSLGIEYIFNKQFVTRLDYTWKTSVNNIINRSIKSDLIGDAVFSFGWKFGHSHIDEDFSSYDAQSLNQQYTALNENINFPFNSSDLKPVSYDKLKKLDDDIKNMQLKNISIILLGHSDQIGSKEYNQKLSEDRAYSIKNYLTSKGYSDNQITVQGMGNLYPLTDQVCKNIENKPLLISCLAPDRRVEIEVLSTQ